MGVELGQILKRESSAVKYRIQENGPGWLVINETFTVKMVQHT